MTWPPSAATKVCAVSRGVGGVLPPGFEQIEQLWRSLTEQCARKGAAITKQYEPRTR